VALTEAAPLFENLEAVSSGVHKSPHTDCMEAFGQSYGFILYRKKLDLKGGPHRLSIVEPRDRAQVFLDGRKVATLYRNDKSFDVQTDSAVSGEATLDVLVENMGRFNIGWRMDDNRKGISTGVVLDGHQLLNAWTIHTLPFEKLDGLKYKALEGRPRLPAFLRGTFEVDEAADTFLRLPANGKGVCWINGFNLGRFWNPQGPQLSLYIPGPLLKKGPNSLEILELERLDANYVELVDKP
jgi:beta-galactosidase